MADMPRILLAIHDGTKGATVEGMIHGWGALLQSDFEPKYQLDLDPCQAFG